MLECKTAIKIGERKLVPRVISFASWLISVENTVDEW